PFPRVRSVAAIDSRPNEQFTLAAISGIDNSRNCVQADIEVPAGDRSALVTFSRPYFPGYQARLGNKKLTVSSYGGLMPMVEVPSSSRGRLVLTYRPWWLVLGASASFL